MNEAHKRETPLAGGVTQVPNQITDAAIVAPLDECGNAGKREATLMAQFALAGHAVHRLADGGFLVCRHGYVKHCPDLAALSGFARQSGVRS